MALLGVAIAVVVVVAVASAVLALDDFRVRAPSKRASKSNSSNSGTVIE